MIVFTFTGFYLPGFKGGGPIKTIKNLFDQTGDDITYRLVTSDRDLGDSTNYKTVACGRWNHIGKSTVFYAAAGISGYVQIFREMLKNEYGLVYLNSFFSPRFSFYPLLIAKMLGKNVVLGPRGEFSIGALSIKPLKKNLFIKVFKMLGFHHGTIFQASSEHEAVDIRRVLGPNIDIRIAEDIGAEEYATTIPQRNSESTRIMFVSRISPKKNLLQAIQILQRVKNSVVYDIYGPIEDKEYWAICEVAIKQLPAHVEVRHQGVLAPDQVVDKMATYDMFFMPTLGENYGHVIAEAFCAGLPVLIADTTPWRQLEEKGIGWDIPLSEPEKFAQVIDEFAALTLEEYQIKRQKVLQWAKHKFSQRDAIEANIAMFKYAYEKSRKQ